MSANEKNSIKVELHPYGLTDRKDDRYGRAVTTKSLNENDLVALAVERRTDISASTMKAVVQLLTDIAIEQVADGASVRFGLGYFNLGVSGVFVGSHAKWDSGVHRFFVKAAPVAKLRSAVATCKGDVRGMAAGGLCINSVTDVSTGAINSVLTAGGGVNVEGVKIKLEGVEGSVGLYLTHMDTNQVTPIVRTAILVNKPSQLSFILPTKLASGSYKLGISTQYTSHKKLLKEPRHYQFDAELELKNDLG